MITIPIKIVGIYPTDLVGYNKLSLLINQGIEPCQKLIHFS